MLRRTTIALVILIFSLPFSLSAFRMRLATYNIRNGMGIDDLTSLSRVASVIDSIAPDVIALQEVDSVTKRSGGVDVAAELARLSGMKSVFSPAIDFDGGKYGVAILTRDRPLSVSAVPLPGSEEPRVCLLARFADFAVASTHLSLMETDRFASMPLILGAVDSCSVPVFIMGDFNDIPESSFIGRLSEKFFILNDSLVPTYPSDVPAEHLDYIIAPRNRIASVTVVSTAVISSPASDHLPVVVDVEIE